MFLLLLAGCTDVAATYGGSLDPAEPGVVREGSGLTVDLDKQGGLSFETWNGQRCRLEATRAADGTLTPSPGTCEVQTTESPAEVAKAALDGKVVTETVKVDLLSGRIGGDTLELELTFSLGGAKQRVGFRGQKR